MKSLSELMNETDTLKEKVRVACEMEQSVRCELDETRHSRDLIARERDMLRIQQSKIFDEVQFFDDGADDASDIGKLSNRIRGILEI